MSKQLWYHLTDRARFKLDPKHAPADNAIAIEDRSGRPGIYVAKNVERWVNGHNYWRPFVVEFEVDPSVASDPGVHGRWGGEMFVPAASFGKLEIKRVIPLDAYAREEFGEPGWIEYALGEEFDTGAPIQRHTKKFRGYKYSGPDVRGMTAAEVTRLKGHFRRGMMVKRRGMSGGTVRSRARGVHYDVIDSWSRSGHYYRGMTAEELRAHLAAGYVKSNGRWSVPDEGTCFADNSCSAESYANFGRTDPRVTGEPTYLIEVPASAANFVIDKRDGYPKLHERLPVSKISRIWQMRARGDDVVATEVTKRNAPAWLEIY